MEHGSEEHNCDDLVMGNDEEDKEESTFQLGWLFGVIISGVLISC